MQPDRLPKQAKAWSLFSDRLAPLDLPNLPQPPAHLASLARAPKRPGAKEGVKED